MLQAKTIFRCKGTATTSQGSALELATKTSGNSGSGYCTEWEVSRYRLVDSVKDDEYQPDQNSAGMWLTAEAGGEHRTGHGCV